MSEDTFVYGYARVSIREQKTDRQIAALKAAGVGARRILVDKISEKSFERPQYNLLVGAATSGPLLRAGDLLVVTSLDRLGRNYTEILKEWERLTYDLDVDIRVLDMPLLDTSNSDNAATFDRRFMCNLVLQILSYVAEKERLSIGARQREGIEAAKKANKRFGRPPAAYPDNWETAYEKWIKKEVPVTQLQRELNLKKPTFYKLVKRYEAEKGIVHTIKILGNEENND